MFVDELAEKHSVPCSHLKSLPQNRYPHHRHFNGTFELMKEENCLEKQDNIDGMDWKKCSKHGLQGIENAVDLNQFTDFSNFQPWSYEMVTMPLASHPQSERTGNQTNDRNNINNQTNNKKPPQPYVSRSFHL